MARPRKNAKKETKKETQKHIDHIDIYDDGILRELAIVKRWDDGSFSYIEIAPLDPIDKGRIKKIISGQHADKYELWELMSQARLSNGMNALDYFHSNLVKHKKVQGSTDTAVMGGIDTAPVVPDTMIGSEFTDPSEAQIDDGSNFDSFKK